MRGVGRSHESSASVVIGEGISAQPIGSGQRVLMRGLAAMFCGGAGACALPHSGPDEATAHAHNLASAFFPARSSPDAFASSLKRAAAPAGAERGGRGAMRPQQAPVSGKVFIQRDYSGGTRCQFQSKFPAELENRVKRITALYSCCPAFVLCVALWSLSERPTRSYC